MNHEGRIEDRGGEGWGGGGQDRRGRGEGYSSKTTIKRLPQRVLW